MKSLKKHIIMSALATALMIALLIPSAVFAADGSFDFHSSALEKQVIPASSFLSMLGIANLSQDELYCYEEAGLELVYSVPKNKNLISANVENGVLKVEAQSTEYSAQDGQKIKWTPSTVQVGTTNKAPTSVKGSTGKYEAIFEGLEKGKVYTVSVEFHSQVAIDSATLNQILSIPYEMGADALQKESAYKRELAEYEDAIKRFEADSAVYAQQLAEYENYLKAVSDYQYLVSLYREYLMKVDEYEAALAVYEAYLKELESYQNALATYETSLRNYEKQLKQYNTYLNYLAAVEDIRSKMRTINSVYEPNGIYPSLYDTIMGDTVSEVVSRKDELISLGASDVDVNNSGKATEALRKYLDTFASKETEKEKLAYYRNYYSAIKSNFLKLYNSLSTLFESELVRVALDTKGKLERYQIFLKDLDEVCEGFSVVENSYPSTSTWPKEVKEVECPVKPDVPIPPSEVEAPVKTWTVAMEEPQPPKEVKNPVKPVKEDYVKTYPTAPILSDRARSLMKGIENGSIKKRSVKTNVNITLKFSSACSAYLPEERSKTVYYVITFYNGNDICYNALVEEGKAIVFGGNTPTRPSDNQYDYVFDGWTDQSGKKATLSKATANCDFYASYKGTLRKYEVTFVSKERTETVLCNYGELPNPKGLYTQSYEEMNVTYTFSGWNSSISPVTGNATYVAVYSGKANEYQIVFCVRDQQYVVNCTHGEYPVLEDLLLEYREDGKRYEFVGWSPTVVPASSDAVYTAVYREAPIINPSDIHPGTDDPDYCIVSVSSHSARVGEKVKEAIRSGRGLILALGEIEIVIEKQSLADMGDADTFSIIRSEDGKFVLSICDDRQNEIKCKEFLLAVPFDFAGGSVNAYLNGEKCDASYAGGKVYIKLFGSGNIEIRNTFIVTVLYRDGDKEVTSSFFAESGSVATISVPPSTETQSTEILYVKDEDGNDISYSAEDHTFVMPESSVKVEVLTAPRQFVIVFQNGDREISSSTYGYGDTVILPPTPGYIGPAPEAGKQYVFSGWDPVVSTVDGDQVYVARFVLEDISDKYVRNDIVDKIGSMKNLIFTLLGLGLLIIVAIPVFFVVRNRKKKKVQG